MSNSDKQPERIIPIRVRVAGCTPMKFQGTPESEWYAAVTFLMNQKFYGPLALSVLQVRALIEDLQKFLQRIEPKDGLAVGADGGWGESALPPIQSVPCKDKRNSNVRPSRRSASPRTPISAREEVVLRHLLRNVRNHEDFMRFIGADVIAAASISEKHVDTAPQPTKRRKTKNKKRKA